MMRYAYYPGCSMEGISRAYADSLRQVAERLGLRLEEIDDWNCCGATEYFAVSRLAAHAVIARNLALVGAEHDQVVAPCSACYLNLRKTEEMLRERRDLAARVNDALAAGGLHYEPGRLRVRHLLEVIREDVGESRVRQAVVQPLSGLRVAPYYGCQIVRPLHDGEDPEQPRGLDDVLRWLGAKVVHYPLKASCCGGHLTQISETQALELIRRLLQGAADQQADVIACLCPMCQLNLDAYQDRVNTRFGTEFAIPVLFFTQLMGLAFGLPARALGFGREMVPADGVLASRLGVAAEPEAEAAEAEPAAAPRRLTGRKEAPEGLPMPRMDRQEN